MKNKKYLLLIPVVVAILVFIGVYIYYYREDGNSLTVTDKKWIDENITSLVDIELASDYPVYGDADGVFDSFIEGFEDATGVEFNRVSYLKEDTSETTGLRFQILGSDQTLGDKDLLINEDVYVLVGNEQLKIDNISDLSGMKLGILSNDVAEVSYYMSSYKNITFKSYDSADKLFHALAAKDVDMIVTPHVMYLNKIFDENEYHINYTLADMSKKIVLTLNDENTKLNSIVKKYFEKWKNNSFVEKYNEALFNYYVEKKAITDSEKTALQAKTYVYGYVENYPYEGTYRGKLVGICGEYINRISRFTGVDFEYKKYKSVDKLLEAVNAGEVDIYFNYYDVANENYRDINSTFVEEYVVLAAAKDSQIVTSFESLKGKKVAMIGKTALFNYFKDNSKADIKEFKSYKDMINNNIPILVVDRETYLYYRNSTFKNYEVLYSDYMAKNYAFMVKKDEDNFYNIFNYLASTNSYYRYRNLAINDLDQDSQIEASSFEELYIIILVLILVPIIIFVVVYVLLKRKSVIKKVKKEERRKYTDMLTSLKNRNYLNLNMEIWNKSEKYPQTIVVIDLNNVKYVNDNYGHEAGDKLIVQAASTLVNTQLENSEIIRTDGNEFLIYLVGYSEKQIEIYTKKLTKEFKELPYGFGAAIGYSMITDGMKTIDDAINEATLEMRNDKEDYK